MRSAIVLFTAVVACAGQVAAAQPDPAAPPLSLTFDEALDRGLSSSHRIIEAEARRDASGAALDERHAAMRPQVAAMAGYTRTNHVEEFSVPLPNNQLRVIYPDIPDNYRTRLDVQWPVYSGGRLEALAEAARLETSATSHDVEAMRVDLRLEIARSYWNLVVADESLRVVTESLARTDAHLQDVRNQLTAGLVAPNEVLTVQAQESRQRMLRIQAQSAREIAESDLARLIGADPGTAIQPSTPLEPTPVDWTVEPLVARALDQRRDRQALADRLTGARARERAAAAGKQPSVGLAGGVDYARPNTRIFPRQGEWKESWDVSVNVTWPIFDGGRTHAETAAASASRRALQARADEFDSLLALEVRQRLAEIASTRAAIVASDDALGAATEARRVVGERFNAGVATSTDVIDAQMTVLQAGLDRTQAMANARLADARLQRALGQ